MQERVSVKGGNPGSLRRGAIHSSHPYCYVCKHVQDFVPRQSLPLLLCGMCVFKHRFIMLAPAG